MPVQKDSVQAFLQEDAPRFSLHIEDAMPSTNSALLRMAKEGAPSGTVLLTHHQTQGRGTRGRTWQSGKTGALTFSLLWRFHKDAPLSGLSLCVGLAMTSALSGLGFSGIGLKWPNDVLYAGQKLAGILIELDHDASAKTQAAVIGMGLNISLPPPTEVQVHALSPTALLEITNAPSPLPSESAIFAALLRALARHLDRFAKEGFLPFKDAWQMASLWQNHPVRLVRPHQPDIFGVCKGVNDEGALLLAVDGEEVPILAGDVSLRSPA